MAKMNLIYIGDKFYGESDSIMSPIYTESGQRSDWGFVQLALRKGDSVHIRQATPMEREFYEDQLNRLKSKRKEREDERKESKSPT